MTRQVELKTGGFTLVDDEDFSTVSAYRWPEARGYVESSSPIARIKMHRMLMGDPEGMHIDHINVDLMDNRRANLRVCTAAENLKNQRKSKSNTTGYKGVVKTRTGAYRASICADGRTINAGTFATALHAAVAYDDLAIKHHGQFGRLNFSPERDWLFVTPGNWGRARRGVARREGRTEEDRA